MKTKKQIANELLEGKAVANFLVDSFKNDEKVRLLNTEKMTQSEFIQKITADDPYDVVELHEGKYQVMNKNVNLPLEAHIDTEKIKKLDRHYDLIIKIYPELKDYIKFVEDKIKTGCQSCGRAGFSYKILYAIKVYGGLNRNVEDLVPILGRIFVNKLKEIKEDKKTNLNFVLYGKTTQSNSVKPVATKTVKHVHGWIRNQCLACTGKHIATALCLLKEYLSDKVEYSDNYWEAIGELACGEHECMNIESALANNIRHDRLNIMEDRGHVPDLSQHFKLIDKLTGVEHG